MASPFLLDISRDMRLRGYSLQTEKTYLHWILRYIRFIDRRHPSEAGPREVREFLTWLAADFALMSASGRFESQKDQHPHLPTFPWIAWDCLKVFRLNFWELTL